MSRGRATTNNHTNRPRSLSQPPLWHTYLHNSPTTHPHPGNYTYTQPTHSPSHPFTPNSVPTIYYQQQPNQHAQHLHPHHRPRPPFTPPQFPIDQHFSTNTPQQTDTNTIKSPPYSTLPIPTNLTYYDNVPFHYPTDTTRNASTQTHLHFHPQATVTPTEAIHLPLPPPLKLPRPYAYKWGIYKAQPQNTYPYYTQVNYRSRWCLRN